ncbi:hypothetical protein GCM10007391_07230 [Alteromonas halophila]|uniref:Uncharacterized protein n=1 Tax=Alteromonas halophila TaxID=516698 RepID=A0A918MV02_9ALTE|nr:hypothetical protein GCM10007391_07230 [Alteromonas halophila]
MIMDTHITYISELYDYLCKVHLATYKDFGMNVVLTLTEEKKSSNKAYRMPTVK